MEPTLMKLKHKASKSASEDIISRMPDDVITHIMNRLPIQYAVMTSILSRNWRFKWTLLNEVVFDDEFYNYLEGLGDENWYEEKIISRVLFHLKGSITKFYLLVPEDKVLDVTEIDNWVMLLSRKGIKEFNLINIHVKPLMLSSNIFSCVKLERLILYNCSLYPTPIFCGFPCLLHLDLDDVSFENGNFGKFITHCPLLELLKICCFSLIGKVKLFEIAQLKNLKLLSFPLRNLDTAPISNSLDYNLVGHFSKLQELNLDLHMCEFFGESGARNWVRTFFRCLRTLTLHFLDFGNDIQLSFAFEMIWASPELQTLKITAYDVGPPPTFCSSALNHISMGQLKLRFVVFEYLRGSENEICLIKNLLACSPALNKINIYASSSRMFGGENGKLMFATKLLKLPRASYTAEVNIYWI